MDQALFSENCPLAVEDERPIEKRPYLLPYPTVTIIHKGRERAFYFNATARKLLTGPYIKFTAGYIRGEKYICFRNSRSACDFHFTASCMYADKVLEHVGLKCVKLSSAPRRCVRIKDGLAIKAVPVSEE